MIMFICTECEYIWEEWDDCPWPVECPDCGYYHCGDDDCCFGEGFAMRPVSPMPECSLPPAGWACSRRPGHSGPCAARKIGRKDYGN